MMTEGGEMISHGKEILFQKYGEKCYVWGILLEMSKGKLNENSHI